MTVFTVTDSVDPFLQVSMRKGEMIYCESDAMVTMSTTLELKGKMKGGLLGGIMRTFANGESLFQQHIEASGGDGECLLAPTLPGAMKVIDIGATQYMVSDGAFVASTNGVDLKVRTQSLGGAIFGQTGGFFITETSGQGQLAVSGFGSMSVVEVEPGKDLIVDNAHVVCWDSRLDYTPGVATGSGGLFGKLVNSVTSGEGVVLRFSGRGKVYVCSRNRIACRKWMQQGMSQGGSGIGLSE
jgi:uncharacterized protein (TIGR00266 family)